MEEALNEVVAVCFVFLVVEKLLREGLLLKVSKGEEEEVVVALCSWSDSDEVGRPWHEDSQRQRQWMN